MLQLRIALFVEGSESPPQPGIASGLNRIWNEILASKLDLHPFDPIVPISKKHLVAMDPATPSMSGAGERLDQLMVRMLERNTFDAAVVAWDLAQSWNP